MVGWGLGGTRFRDPPPKMPASSGTGEGSGYLLYIVGYSWVLPTPELWEAGERPGSACAIEVEGLKRRPPM